VKDQIREILSREKISSSQFADRIGVQRSSVSHVLSGRNKPGFDFIQKILIAFPSINGEWLITGSGDMYKQKLSPGGLFEPQKSVESPGIMGEKEETSKPASTGKQEKDKDQVKEEAPKRRSIEKIIVFYNDRTFREYDAEN
jgi:transcriptional regulator with XRE-family HTH domain